MPQAVAGRVAGASLLLAALAAAPAAGAIVEEIVSVMVTAGGLRGGPFTQPITVTVFRDDERERSPFLVLNHGRSSANREKVGRVRYSENSHYFVSKGFAVFVPTRMGYGVSGGEDVEYSGDCEARQFNPSAAAAAQQVLKVIEHARSMNYVDPERGLVVGQSYGGVAAIAVAAKQAPGVRAAVNFAGGGGGRPSRDPGNPCSSAAMEALFTTYGATSRIPTLWLYSENDRYWGRELPPRWFEAFRKRGAAGEFMPLPPLLPPLGGDGHRSFTRNPLAWRPVFEDFLRRNGFAP